MPHTVATQGSTFSNLNLSSRLLSILSGLGFVTPTPIQQKAIPLAAAGKDVIGIAQTGTGKTLAFALPLLQQIARSKKQGLIILPTRELAMQVEETLQKVGRSLGLKTVLLIGGAPMGWQLKGLREQPHVIIGTPGRMIDHLNQGTLKLDRVGVLVLDEADRMLDMGFAPQIKRLVEKVPRDRQTLLFSATMPPAIATLARVYMRDAVRVEMAPAGTVAERVEHELFVVAREQKSGLLNKLLEGYAGTVLVFARTKYGAKKICRSVRGMGHSAAEIHSNLSLSQRRRSLEGFRSGTFRILVATDIASRGIDVTNIEAVINYDLPDDLDDYVHRVGRTGRAGREGRAISFVTPDQRHKIRNLENLVKKTLRVSPLPPLPKMQAVQAEDFRRDERRDWPRRESRRKRARLHF